ncbi:MAG: class I SAM-dependent methyltransferase [Gaiella sp.]
MSATPLTDRLRTAPPGLHGKGQYWGLAWAALGWLESNARPEWATLEIGAGASTIVLAAAGCEHEAVTPDAGELARIRESCQELGIDSSRVRGLEGLSHEILPAWSPRPLDLVLIDGAHGFPYPVLDWWYLAPHVKIGGHVLLDDAYLPAVGVIVDYVRQSPHWELQEAVSFRTAHVVKRSLDTMPFDADAHAAHGRMRFQYLSPGRRLTASVRQRAFSTKAGLWVVEWLQGRRSG